MVTKNPKTLGDEFLNDKFVDIPEDDEDIGRRILDVDGKEFLLRKKDPFGFWEFHSANPGAKPLELRGTFTNIHNAERALAQYTSRMSKPTNVVNQRHKDKLGPNFANRAQRSMEREPKFEE